MEVLRKNWFPLAATVVIIAIIAFLLLSRMDKGSDLDFSLQNLSGETISLDNTKGKARLIYFYFAHCPDVCLPTNHLLYQVQEGLKEKGVFGEDALIMSITFDPVRDTVEYLKEYSNTMQADPSGWHFLRDDDVEAVRALAEAYGVTVIPDGDDNFIHANLYTLLDGKGEVYKTYSPNEVIVFDPSKREAFLDEIVQDMAALSR